MRYGWTFDRVRVVSMSYGRALALHKHKRRRVRKKYTDAIVLIRGTITKENIHEFMVRFSGQWMLSAKGRRRFCRALCKMGIDARVERRRR